jgi:hypothetical protein
VTPGHAVGNRVERVGSAGFTATGWARLRPV